MFIEMFILILKKKVFSVDWLLDIDLNGLQKIRFC